MHVRRRDKRAHFRAHAHAYVCVSFEPLIYGPVCGRERAAITSRCSAHAALVNAQLCMCVCAHVCMEFSGVFVRAVKLFIVRETGRKSERALCMRGILVKAAVSWVIEGATRG